MNSSKLPSCSGICRGFYSEITHGDNGGGGGEGHGHGGDGGDSDNYDCDGEGQNLMNDIYSQRRIVLNDAGC